MIRTGVIGTDETPYLCIADDLPEMMQLAELSLKEMKHVFIAQPDQLKRKEMQYLKKLAEESDVVLQFGTGYKYCPAYHKLAETMQVAKLVDIRHQLVNSSEWHTKLNRELSFDFDFVTSVLNTNIRKYSIRTWAKSEKSLDVLHCSLECDNGNMVNLMAYTVAEGDPKLEMTFTSSDAVIRADIFKSVIEKQYRTCNKLENFILDAYNEKAIYKYYLENFYRAICNDSDAIRSIDKQFQNRVAADDIVERIRFVELSESFS